MFIHVFGSNLPTGDALYKTQRTLEWFTFSSGQMFDLYVHCYLLNVVMYLAMAAIICLREQI